MQRPACRVGAAQTEEKPLNSIVHRVVTRGLAALVFAAPLAFQPALAQDKAMSSSQFGHRIPPSMIRIIASLAASGLTRRLKSFWLRLTRDKPSFPGVQLHIVDAPLGAGPE